MNVYEKTRQEIEKRGWTQGISERFSGEVCLMGALSYAINDSVFYTYEPTKYSKKLAKIIQEQYPDFIPAEYADNDSTAICHSFNDTHTKEEIFMLLEKAAADA